MRTALITGGANGIGAAAARLMARDGFAVVLADIDFESARAVAQEIKGTALALDVSDREQAKSAIKQFESIDVLVNNAGFNRGGYFTSSLPADWHRLLAVNLIGTLNCTQLVLPKMYTNGYGRIINVASEAGRIGARGDVVYSASKGGVIAFTRALARESAQYGVTVNAVAPGPTKTALIESMPDKAVQAIVDSIPFKRLGSPEEVASCIAYLASESASYLTGEIIGVSGGMGIGA